jgi:hypothetical protein
METHDQHRFSCARGWTGVVVIVVTVAIVLVALFVTASMRGRQLRAAQRA